MDFDSQWRSVNDYYLFLGAAPGADCREQEAAFGRRARQCHPDQRGFHAVTVLLNEAWEALSNPDARRRSDEILAQRACRQVQTAFVYDVNEARQKAQAHPSPLRGRRCH